MAADACYRSPMAEDLRSGVHRLVSDWDRALHFQGARYWKIPSGNDPLRFFQALPIIFPYGQSLLFEGLEMGLSAKSLYEEFPAKYRRLVACDTISPQPEAFHVVFDPTFAEHLSGIIRSQGMESAFYHFKGYSSTELIFSFHSFSDAFDVELTISESVSETTVTRFAEALGQRAAIATFPEPLIEQLKKFDAIINPSRWRRLLNVFRQRN